MMLTDTQALEGINSMIKHMVRLAPNMRLKLLSSRVVIKKTLADRVTSKAAREELLQFAVGNHENAVALAPLADGRFEVVESGGSQAGPEVAAVVRLDEGRSRLHQRRHAKDEQPGPSKLCAARALASAMRKLDTMGKQFDPDVSIGLSFSVRSMIDEDDAPLSEVVSGRAGHAEASQVHSVWLPVFKFYSMR
eukprot:11403730-Alexandrium_andersonii.AAC.1